MEVPEPRTVRWRRDEAMGVFYGGGEVGGKGKGVVSFQFKSSEREKITRRSRQEGCQQSDISDQGARVKMLRSWRLGERRHRGRRVRRKEGRQHRDHRDRNTEVTEGDQEGEERR
jgi:hypothetical protein